MNMMAILVLIPSIIVHELAHGFMALRAGDDTAKRMGRLTFNPVSHIDPLGSIIIPGLLIMSGAGFVFGYAKPVPINPSLFRRGKRDLLWVAAAGPISNLILMVLAVVGLKFLGSIAIFRDLFFTAIIYNFILAIFNLIPFPPLDGSRILDSFLSYENSMKLHQLERYGIVILFIAMSMGWFDAIFRIFQPLLVAILHLAGQG